MGRQLAVLMICVIGLAGISQDFPAIYSPHEYELHCISPLWLMGAGIAMLIVLRKVRIHSPRWRLAIAMLVSVFLIGSYQVLGYQIYLQRAWTAIFNAVSTQLPFDDVPGIPIRGRWSGIVTAKTTADEGYKLLDDAIYKATGVTGVLGYIVYKTQWGFYDDLTFQHGSWRIAGYIPYQWLPFQCLLVFGCLIGVAEFAEKRKFKRKNGLSKLNLNFLFGIEEVLPDPFNTKQHPSNVREATEEDTPYSV